MLKAHPMCLLTQKYLQDHTLLLKSAYFKSGTEALVMPRETVSMIIPIKNGSLSSPPFFLFSP
jgi:hypothetical protein